MAPIHYLNQCWNIVNLALGNKLQRLYYRNSNIFTHENAFENVISEMASILPRPHFVNSFSLATGKWNRLQESFGPYNTKIKQSTTNPCIYVHLTNCSLNCFYVSSYKIINQLAFRHSIYWDHKFDYVCIIKFWWYKHNRIYDLSICCAIG